MNNSKHGAWIKRKYENKIFTAIKNLQQIYFRNFL